MSKSGVSSRRRKALGSIHYYAERAGIDKEDRLIIASKMLDFDEHEIESYADLSTDDLEYLVIAFRGWFCIQSARWATGVLVEEAHHILEHVAEEQCSESLPENSGYIL